MQLGFQGKQPFVRVSVLFLCLIVHILCPRYCGHWSVGDAKVDAAVAIYPRLSDPDAFEVALNSLFKFESDRSEIKEKIAAKK